LWGDEIPIGKFFERTDLPSLHESEPVLKSGPLVKQNIRVPADIAKAFIDELM
jgi:2-oxoglutarate ferredoxin oxidoreductase subunit beta